MGMSNRLLRPRQTGFNPRSISGLALWLDAADTSTVTADVGVTTWRDKSNDARNATQGVGNKQPIYINSINSRRVVTFQGVDDTLQVAANAAFNADSQTIIIVSRQTTAANQSLWYKADSGSADGVIMRYRTGTTFWHYQKNDVTGETLGWNGNTNTATNVYTTILEPTAQAGFVNGTLRVSNTVATVYNNNATVWLGSRRDVGEYFNGDIAEILFWPRALTSLERSLVERALGKKWGVTVA